MRDARVWDVSLQDVGVWDYLLTKLFTNLFTLKKVRLHTALNDKNYNNDLENFDVPLEIKTC